MVETRLATNPFLERVVDGLTRLPLPTGVDLQVFRAVDISDGTLDGQPGHSSVSVLRGTLSG